MPVACFAGDFAFAAGGTDFVRAVLVGFALADFAADFAFEFVALAGFGAGFAFTTFAFGWGVAFAFRALAGAGRLPLAGFDLAFTTFDLPAPDAERADFFAGAGVRGADFGDFAAPRAGKALRAAPGLALGLAFK